MTGSSAQLDANKQTVLDFYETAFNRKDVAGVTAFLGDRYIQHNPQIADGRDGLRVRLRQLADAFPDLHVQVRQLVAEGDYVTARVHAVRVPGQRGVAIMDMFRLENGKLVEHWDVMQDIPEHSENPNEMV
ncbi:nuclear transport factor 2 family protein [Actinomadura rupiterrae]|uniref:nuclear transport factor 2 family protein n=1 Tax=Actinomadura rupiterrae TaxID=559627 RepID=UPI0020A2FE86|nr:ester cyclase [Actinomadura rupiterrae]MCP2341541.1 putative SnoaL-like aldol condensation-catalyzing enzyme [Actinomadura rupiterrae]